MCPERWHKHPTVRQKEWSGDFTGTPWFRRKARADVTLGKAQLLTRDLLPQFRWNQDFVCVFQCFYQSLQHAPAHMNEEMTMAEQTDEILKARMNHQCLISELSCFKFHGWHILMFPRGSWNKELYGSRKTFTVENSRAHPCRPLSPKRLRFCLRHLEQAKSRFFSMVGGNEIWKSEYIAKYRWVPLCSNTLNPSTKSPANSCLFSTMSISLLKCGLSKRILLFVWLFGSAGSTCIAKTNLMLTWATNRPTFRDWHVDLRSCVDKNWQAFWSEANPKWDEANML